MVVLHTYTIAFVPSYLRDAEEYRNTRDYLKVRAQIMNGGVQSGGRNSVGVPSFVSTDRVNSVWLHCPEHGAEGGCVKCFTGAAQL